MFSLGRSVQQRLKTAYAPQRLCVFGIGGALTDKVFQLGAYQVECWSMVVMRSRFVLLAPVYRCGFLAVSLVPLFSHTLNKVNGFLVVSYGVVDPACLAERQLDIRPALSPAVCLRRVSYLAVHSLYMRFWFNGCNGHGGVDWRQQSSGHFSE
ncbi:hypothetical protein Bca4012_079341 [Brassica carinata]